MIPPPIELIPKYEGVISKALESLRDEERAKVLWIANVVDGKVNVNGAFVMQNESGNFKIVAWVGRKWGEPIEAGVAGSYSF